MGNLYVENAGTTGNSPLVRITTAGVVSTLKISGLTSPTSLAAGYGLTADSTGNLYIPDWNNSRIVFANVSGSALGFLSTKQGFTSTDSPKTATVTNLGDQPLVFSADPTYTADFPENGSDINPCTSSTSLSNGTSCDLSIEFIPQSIGSISAGITVTNNALNVAGSTQQLSASGIGTNPGDVTATSVAISPASLTNGQTATLTATVADTTHPSTLPTGAVTFTDMLGSASITLNGGSAVSLSGGHATLTGVLLRGIGVHTITAHYPGITGTYIASTGPNTVEVVKAPITLAGPSTQPILVTTGQASSATITVTGPYATIAVPSGTLTYSILDGSSTSVASGTLTLTAGTVSSTAVVPIPNMLTSGNYTITVAYSGDANYLASPTATTIPVQIGQIQPTVSWAQPGAITYGTTLSGILNATALNGATPVAGTFAFTETPAGGSPAPATNATVLSAGNYTLSATFTPTDATTYKSASGSVSLTVNQAEPTINWAPPAAITYGTPLSGLLTAVAQFASGTVPGTYVYIATPANGPAATVTGAAVLPAGSYAFAVTFTPADTVSYKPASASAALSVSQAMATITLTSSANPVLSLNPTTLTATVSSSIAAPAGSVSFLDGTTQIGTGTLNASGVATLVSSSLSVGTHSITAVYTGSVNFLPATSSAISESVQDFSLAISGGTTSVTSVTVLPGGTAVFTLVISPVNATVFPAAINLSASGLPAGATATFAPSSIAAGAGTTTVTLTIAVPQTSTTAAHRSGMLGSKLAPFALALLLLPFAGGLRKAGKRFGSAISVLLLLFAGLAAMTGLSGCGTTTGFFGQPQHSYAVTVTGTSGLLSHSTTITLTVE